MKHNKFLIAVIGIGALLLGIGNAQAGIAYGTLNNFDCVNDTGVQAHGFDIEMDDIQSKDITYTYDYNHYGVPRITEDITSVPGHTNVLIRYSAVRTNGGWSAYTAVPSGPISPTDGHQFTDPTVNFGGEHFGVGYYGAPSAVKYFWLIDDGAGNLIHGPPVNVSTPTFTYNPPVGAAPANVVAVIVPPPPPAPPVLQFGDASWVKSIKTTTHNTNQVELVDLVADDEGQPQPWANGEPAEVEIEWKLLQTEFANAANPKGVLQGAEEDLPEGDEVITRRYEFYKYTGPIDMESGEAVADAVAANGTNGVGSVTFNSSIDPATGEWVTQTVDLSTNVVVGDFFGAQMSGFDVAPNLGLIDHLQDGQINVPYPDRTVVIAGGAPFLAALKSGSLPNGMELDPVSGVLSGTPTAAGEFIFTVEAVTTGAVVSKTYTNTITAPAAPGSNTVAISSSPALGGTTTGGGTFANGADVTVTAVTNAGYAFVNWTEGGVVVSASTSYTFTLTANRSLVANFAAVYTIATSASPATDGTTSGGGTYNSGSPVTVTATANPGFAFEKWTEGDVAVSASASYTFSASADRNLVAHFVPAGTFTITTSASPSAGGLTSPGGTVNYGDSFTVVAAANPGYDFVNWAEGGAVVSLSASYTFTVTTNHDLVANFVPNSYTVTTSASPSTGGATSGGGTVSIGSSVTVVATANAGYNFVNWTEGGAEVSSSASYTFTASANRTLVANFVSAGTVTITASASPVAGGTTSGGGIFNIGGSVTVVASANAGYNFVNWTEGGAVVSSSASYTFTASVNRTLMANFARITYTIAASASPAAGGTTSGGGTVNSGDSVTVVASANAGYSFVNWTEAGAVVSSSASYTFTASANRTLVANFVPAATSVTISTSASPVAGSTTSGGGTVNSGASVSLVATPNAGYNFVNWTEGGAVVSSSVTYTFTATANRTLVANFVPAATTVAITTSASPVAGGTTSGGGTVNSGVSVTLVATPNAGYNFANWTESGSVVSSSASYTFTATANRTLVANFVPAATITINTSASPSAAGSTSGGGTFNSGASVTVVAAANAGFNFANWTEGGSVVSSSASYTFTATANRTLVANFVPVATIAITTSASPSAGGSTSGGGTFNSGSRVTVGAAANAGYNFVNWTEGGSVVSSSAIYTFTASANRTLVANFVPAATTVTITTSASPSAGGTTSGGGTVNSGARVTVGAAANAGYNFVNWTEGGAVVSSSASYTFTASANRSLVANFVPTTPGLEINSATAIYNRGKVYVTITVRNNGDSVFQAVTIGKKKETTLDGKASHENRPIVLGNIAPGGTETAILTFTGVKAGTRTLKMTLTYKGGTTSLSIPVEVPGKGWHGPPVHTGRGGGKRR